MGVWLRRSPSLAEASLSQHLSLCPGEGVCSTEPFDKHKNTVARSPSRDPTDTHHLWSGRHRARLPLSLSAHGESPHTFLRI